MTAATPVVFLGTTDDVTTCDCCGRENLKSTVALQLHDDVEPEADAERHRREREEFSRRAREEFDADQRVLDAMFPALAGKKLGDLASLRKVAA